MTVTVMGRRLPAVVTYVVALGLALLLMLLTVGAAIWQTNRGVELNVAVRASLESRSHLRMLLRGLQDAEIGQRGYLLTAQESYLGPYFLAAEAVPRELDALEDSAGANAARQAEVIQIRELAVRKMDEIAQTVSLARNGRRNEAMLIVQTDTGLNLMNQLRAVIAAAEAREQADVVDHMAAVDRSAAQLRLIVIGAGALLVAIGALLVGAVRNAMTELRLSRDEARSAHERAACRKWACANRRSLKSVRCRRWSDRPAHWRRRARLQQHAGGDHQRAAIASAALARGETDIARFTDAAMDGARRAATLTSRLLAFARRQPLAAHKCSTPTA
jgi:CHASE3 domain sensor protein